MDFFKNLKFWRRGVTGEFQGTQKFWSRRSVTAQLQELQEKQKFWRRRGVTAELKQLQEKQEATQASQKLLEAYLRGRITVLEQQLEERGRERKELETTLRAQIKEEMERDGTIPAAIK
jgi:hypothetical protein